jgi:hypothetical protein
MPARPEEAVAQEPVYEQKGVYCPDNDWLSKCACLNASALNAVNSPIEQQKILVADGHTVAGDSSEDGNG